MVVPSIQAELLAALDKLNESQQRRVLEYARRVPSELPLGTPFSELAEFAGIIESEDLAKMSAAIKGDCSRIDEHAW